MIVSQPHASNNNINNIKGLGLINKNTGAQIVILKTRKFIFKKRYDNIDKT